MTKDAGSDEMTHLKWPEDDDFLPGGADETYYEDDEEYEAAREALRERGRSFADTERGVRSQ